MTAAEERVARLAITQEEVRAVHQNTPDGISGDAPGAPDGTAEGAARGEDEGTGPAGAQAAGDAVPPRPPQPRPRRLSDVDERVVMLLAGRGTTMRARQVALAMGEPDKRGRVEVMLSRPKWLKAGEWVTEQEQGLFRAAAGGAGTRRPRRGPGERLRREGGHGHREMIRLPAGGRKERCRRD
ncbi:hypothetical protein [Actinomadura verrucosospora]|uniref:Uncharacterized protein n=1 Tax=Actinomadura verrucosospora TaxID=46165 RepID=A0A7D3VQU8_ACTVE|nr:hypothetical protein [Actinomadura verrucosospora]QKG20110.1 hypothetical protein ACTIVE_1746 [Actinomadura verrucosospora]